MLLSSLFLGSGFSCLFLAVPSSREAQMCPPPPLVARVPTTSTRETKNRRPNPKSFVWPHTFIISCFNNPPPFFLFLFILHTYVLACALFLHQGWNEGSLVGDKYWHSMVKLHVSEEASWVHDFVDDSLLRFRRKAMEAAAAARAPALPEGESDDIESGGGGGVGWGPELAATQFMCAHVRRQDFRASCSCYEEEYRSGKWVLTRLVAFSQYGKRACACVGGCGCGPVNVVVAWWPCSCRFRSRRIRFALFAS